jgi:hypothetical protein
LRRLSILLATALALTACGDANNQLVDMAESTRSATERAAAKAAAADRARVAKITAIAEAAAAPPEEGKPLALGDRYYLRPDGQGWTVVDRATNTPANTGSVANAKLDLRNAEQLMGDLEELDKSR